jgi:hypothetical protein
MRGNHYFYDNFKIDNTYYRFKPHPQASDIATKLWRADKNRLTPDVDYELDLQGYTKSYERTDRARNPLFSWVKPEVFERPTYKGM